MTAGLHPATPPGSPPATVPPGTLGREATQAPAPEALADHLGGMVGVYCPHPEGDSPHTGCSVADQAVARILRWTAAEVRELTPAWAALAAERDDARRELAEAARIHGILLEAILRNADDDVKGADEAAEYRAEAWVRYLEEALAEAQRALRALAAERDAPPAARLADACQAYGGDHVEIRTNAHWLCAPGLRAMDPGWTEVNADLQEIHDAIQGAYPGQEIAEDTVAVLEGLIGERDAEKRRRLALAGERDAARSELRRALAMLGQDKPRRPAADVLARMAASGLEPPDGSGQEAALTAGQLAPRLYDACRAICPEPPVWIAWDDVTRLAAAGDGDVYASIWRPVRDGWLAAAREALASGPPDGGDQELRNRLDLLEGEATEWHDLARDRREVITEILHEAIDYLPGQLVTQWRARAGLEPQ